MKIRSVARTFVVLVETLCEMMASSVGACAGGTQESRWMIVDTVGRCRGSMLNDVIYRAGRDEFPSREASVTHRCGYRTDTGDPPGSHVGVGRTAVQCRMYRSAARVGTCRVIGCERAHAPRSTIRTGDRYALRPCLEFGTPLVTRAGLEDFAQPGLHEGQFRRICGWQITDRVEPEIHQRGELGSWARGPDAGCVGVRVRPRRTSNA